MNDRPRQKYFVVAIHLHWSMPVDSYFPSASPDISTHGSNLNPLGSVRCVCGSPIIARFGYQ